MFSRYANGGVKELRKSSSSDDLTQLDGKLGLNALNYSQPTGMSIMDAALSFYCISVVREEVLTFFFNDGENTKEHVDMKDIWLI